MPRASTRILGFSTRSRMPSAYADVLGASTCMPSASTRASTCMLMYLVPLLVCPVPRLVPRLDVRGASTRMPCASTRASTRMPMYVVPLLVCPVPRLVPRLVYVVPLLVCLVLRLVYLSPMNSRMPMYLLPLSSVDSYADA